LEKPTGTNSNVEYTFTDASSGDIVVNNLLPATVYSFSARFSTDYGVSPDSKVSEPIVTKPCSPPANHRITKMTSSVLEMEWDEPAQIGNGITISGYKVHATVGNDKIVRNVASARIGLNNLPMGGNIKFSIKAIAPNTKRNVTTVSANNKESNRTFDVSNESHAYKFIVTTLPKTLAAPGVSNIGLNNVTVTWRSSSKIPLGSKIQHYIVTVSQYSSSGTKSMGTSVDSQAGADASFIHISGLAIGTNYGAQVKVITDRGESELSPVMMFKTKFAITQLDKLKGAILQQIRGEMKTADALIDRNLTATISNAVSSISKAWPSGSYCIWRSGNCPPGFTTPASTCTHWPKSSGSAGYYYFGSSFVHHYGKHAHLEIHTCCK